jgi:hypothetical protein
MAVKGRIMNPYYYQPFYFMVQSFTRLYTF